MLQSWSVITAQAFRDLWQGFLSFIPNLLVAIVVLVIGWLIAGGIGKLVTEILNRLKFNHLFKRAGWEQALEKAEFKVDPAKFIGSLCKWVLMIVFLVIALKFLVLGFAIDLGFLDRIVLWLPNLFVAIVIFIVAAIIAEFLAKLVRVSVKKMGLKQDRLIGMMVQWAIYIFAGLAILLQLGVTPSIVNTVVMGIIGTLTLSLGLAFGLGGRQIAGDFLEKLTKKFRE